MRDGWGRRVAWRAAAGAVVAPMMLAVACDGSSDAVAGSPVDEWVAELEVRIGSVDDPVYSLTAIRGLEVGPDGSLYTLHPSEAIIRQFDADGELVRAIGGRGSGPGEFQRARAMGLVGDTLWVMDADGYRISLFALDGTFLDSFQVPFVMASDTMAEIPPRAQGLLTDGTVYGQPPGVSNWLADGRLVDQVPVLITRDGRVTQTLPAMPYRHVVWAVPSPDGPGGVYATQPFEDRTAFAFDLNARALVVLDRPAPERADEAVFTVMKLTFDGDTLFSRTFDYEPIPVRQEELDSVLDALAAEIGERGTFGLTETRARRLAEETLYAPPYRPGARFVLPGRDGTIWLQLEPGDADVTTWLALDSDGEPLGEVELPSNVLVRQVDLPHVWGVETDALDVPYVVRYRVVTPNIALGDADGGATVSDAGSVTARISQGSRHGAGRPSNVIPEVS